MVLSKRALFSSISVLLLGSSLVVGCGDDGDGDSDGPSAGSGGTRAGGGGSGGRAGAGGAGGSKSGNGGTAGAGETGDAGETGEAGLGASGNQGGSGGQGSGGSAAIGGTDAGGQGGTDGGPKTFGEITRVGASVVTGVNDLRGLTYSANGKIYGSGHVGADTSVDRELAVVRFEADGSLDATFGTNGIVLHNLRKRVVEITGGGGAGSGGAGGEGGGPEEVVVNDGDEQSLGVVELANGDLIVQANVRDAAGKGVDVVLVRMTSEGELVNSFGTNGLKRLDLGWTEADNATWTAATGPNDQSWGVSLDDSGTEEKIVVFAFGPAKIGQTSGNPAVQRTDNDRYVVRVLASDGSIDPAFNAGKVFSLNTGGTFSDGARRGIVEADGAIVAAGYTNYGEGLGNHIVLIRLKPDGTPDANFGFGIALPGVARANPFIDDGGIAECYSVAKQSNGRYVTVGYGRATAANTSSSFGWATTDGVDLISVGLFPNGIDTTFGHQGGIAIQSEEFALGDTEDRGRDVIALPDDRLVYVGRFGPNPAIFVTTPDGELDPSSGEEGRFIYDALTAPTSHFYRAALSPDKKRIAAATSNHADGAIMAVLNVEDRTSHD